MSTTTKTAIQDYLILPWTATSEGKAKQFASAIEELFAPFTKARVFEDGDKWGIAVVEGMKNIGDPINDRQIIAAVILLSSFDISHVAGEIYCVAENLDELPKVHKGLAQRARRQFRIEDKLDAILAALSPVDDVQSAPIKSLCANGVHHA